METLTTELREVCMIPTISVRRFSVNAFFWMGIQLSPRCGVSD
jgi:hypothetical protein